MAGQIQGIYTPHMIPFNDAGSIDEGELRSILEFLIDKGIHGLYPNGSTGAFTRLTYEERRRVIEINCEVSQRSGRDVPILAGAYESHIDLTVDTLNYYADLGARSGALIAPYYFSMSQGSINLLPVN